MKGKKELPSRQNDGKVFHSEGTAMQRHRGVKEYTEYSNYK